jgi:hypothetical protein
MPFTTWQQVPWRVNWASAPGQALPPRGFALDPALELWAEKAPHREKSVVDLQALTAIQQNNFTPQPAPFRAPITLTVCVTICPSTTSCQHCFHRTAPLYMERRNYFSQPASRLVSPKSKVQSPRSKVQGTGAAWADSRNRSRQRQLAHSSFPANISANCRWRLRFRGFLNIGSGCDLACVGGGILG